MKFDKLLCLAGTILMAGAGIRLTSQFVHSREITAGITVAIATTFGVVLLLRAIRISFKTDP